MGLKTKVSEKGGQAILPTEGPTIGVCYQVINLGHQKVVFNGEESYKPKLRLTFELPEHRHIFDEDKGEQPLVLSSEFVISMNPKSNLYKFIKSWFPQKDLSEGSEVDFTKLIGKPGLISVVYATGTGKNAGKTFANIGSIMPVPKGMTIPARTENECVVYDVEEHDEDIFEQLPEFLQNKILESKEMIDMLNTNKKTTKAKPTAAEEVFDASNEQEEEGDVF
jgi:hypothetical protein